MKIQNQRREIESGDVKGGGTRAPDEIIGLLANEIVTEFTASKRADLMRQLGSAHFSRGEVSKAAEWLGINRNTLRKKITELDIRVSRRRKLM